MKRGIIYVASNVLNNKKYIGQTITSLNYRKSKHLKNAFVFNYSEKFYKALRKYGKENFNWEIIELNIDQILLDNREIYWIEFYNSFNNGYNMTKGGHTIQGYHHRTDTKEHLSHVMKGKSNLDHYIKRYGEIEGTHKYNDYINKLKERKGKSRLELLIQKYGEEEGKLKYEKFVRSIREMRKRKGACNTLAFFIDKYGEIEGKHKYNTFLNKLKSKEDSPETKKKKSIAKQIYWNKKRGI